jgi:hypothetical protein
LVSRVRLRSTRERSVVTAPSESFKRQQFVRPER